MKSKLETQLDKVFEQMNVKPWVYHVTEYPRNGRMKCLDMFDGVTIVSDHRQSAREIVDLIGSLDYECEHEINWNDPDNPTIVAPATWMRDKLVNRGFYGIAKGRLLKHIKKTEAQK